MDSRTLALVLSTLMELRNARPPRSTARTIATEAVCLVVAVAAGTATIGCAAVALWNYALPSLGATWTPLAVALAFLVACVIALLVMTQARGAARRRDSDPAPYAEVIGRQLAKAIPSAADLAQLAKDKAGILSLAALVGGIVAGTTLGHRGRR